MKQFVRFELDENLEALAGDGSLRTIVFHLTEQTESRGSTHLLVTAALVQRPGNAKLQAFAKRYRGHSPAGIEASAILRDKRGDASDAEPVDIKLDEPAWTANATEDVVLSMHPLAIGMWQRALPNGAEVHLSEIVIETPPQSWHLTEPRTSVHWTEVDQRIETKLEELGRIQCQRIHVFANAPYALGALLGHRLAKQFERGPDLVFYQFNAASKSWDDWGPNRRLVAPLRSEPILRSGSGDVSVSGARHVVVAIHISRQASREEIGSALVVAGAEGDTAWIDVTPMNGAGQNALPDAPAVDRCVHDLDEVLFRVASEHTAAQMHVFYVGPLAVLMRAAAKLHLLPRPTTLYERIQIEGTYVFVPALDLTRQKLLMGPPSAGSGISRGGLSHPLRVLAVATEWESKKGGLSTFNRLLCGALASAGHDVACLVPEITERERTIAKEAGVRLIEVDRALPEVLRLVMKPADVGFAPTVVIGHGRVTGDAARVQARSHFPGSLLVHFVHTAPDDIEWFKGDEISEDASRKADERRKVEVALATQADLVAGVGPVLTRWIRDALHVGALKSVPIHRFDPGLSGIAQVKVRPEAIRVLLLGRAEDRRLKGIDIAVRALARLPGRPPELTIRGVPAGGAQEFSKWVASLAPGLNLRPFGYVSDQETIDADIRMASVVLMPSRSEGFGLVGLEAISAGVPVLVSDQSGLGEVLRKVGTPSAKRVVVDTSGADDDADTAAWSGAIGHVLHNRDAAYADAALLREELMPVLDWKRAVEGLAAELRKVEARRVSSSSPHPPTDRVAAPLRASALLPTLHVPLAQPGFVEGDVAWTEPEGIMLNVAQAFDQLIKKLELTEPECAAAIEQHQDIRKKLRAQLAGVQDDFLTGSYKRGTAIRPPHDIDIFLVLEEAAHGKLRSEPAQKSLEMVHGALAKAYPKASIRVQGRSVNIAMAGVGYDIVPAFVHAERGYLIPDRERKTWIRTDPKIHAEVCSAANQRAGEMLNALIKAAKRWKDVHGKPLGSFHLEVMAYEAFSKGPKSYPEGLQALFAFLEERVQRSCDEPAKLGAKVDQGMTKEKRDAIGAQLKTAATRAQEAIAHDVAGRTEQAHGLWRSLLGDDYPEKGR